MKKQTELDMKHIDVIDGIRAISVIIVLIFHFWQQTWIFPKISVSWLSFIKINGAPLTVIDFTSLARVGYLFVDMMVLLSGFLLSLPLMRCILYGEPMDSAAEYFKKRAARILPSYLFCILVVFVYELCNGGYTVNGTLIGANAARDLISHLTFTFMLRVDTYLSSKLNVVLWTLAVEVWFYILFPVICRMIKGKKNAKQLESAVGRRVFNTVLIAFLMIGFSHVYIYKYVLASGQPFAVFIDKAVAAVGGTINSSYTSSLINQLPGFMGVYAIGILGALVYIAAAKNLKRTKLYAAVCTCLAISAICLIVYLINSCAQNRLEAAEQWQIKYRLILSVVFMFFILSASLSARWFRFLFSNPLMRFLSSISYNLYIWHQWLAVKIKYDLRIPAWQGDTPPNQLNLVTSHDWSAKYALIITIAAFSSAILTTFLIERPAASLITGKPYKWPFSFLNKKRSGSK